MSVSLIVDRRRRALLQNFVTGFPPLAEVESAAGLGRLQVLDEFAGAPPRPARPPRRRQCGDGRGGHAGQDSAFLRIEVLPLLANRQWGSFLEKLASAARVHGSTRTRG
mgnify:CR=1 FL=1